MSSPNSNVQAAFESVLLVPKPARVARWLLAFVAFLVILGFFAGLVIYRIAPDPEHPVARAMRRFDLGHEPSLASYYSSAALGASAGLLLLIGRLTRFADNQQARYWYCLAGILALMSIDEAIMIHEMVDTSLHELLDTRGMFYFAWIIPAMGLVIAVVLFFYPFTKKLNSRTRALFIGSAVLFVAGAIGMEMVAGLIVEKLGYEVGISSLSHIISQSVEEGLEMCGVVLFIFALLDYVQQISPSFRLAFRNSN